MTIVAVSTIDFRKSSLGLNWAKSFFLDTISVSHPKIDPILDTIPCLPVFHRLKEEDMRIVFLRKWPEWTDRKGPAGGY